MRSRPLLLPLIALATATGPATPAAQPPTIRWFPFSYVSYAGDTLAADTGRLVVPESRARPDGPVIQIAVLRVRSTAARPGAPIVYLAGGPGSSALAGMRGESFPTVAALRTVSDVVLFDQRGTGFTLPSLGVRGTIGGVALDQPLAAGMDSVVARARAAAAEVRARGVDLKAYNTAESADDIDDLRRALGAERVIVWGHSYGSHLGLAYLKRHGARVERAMLGGVNGLDQRRRHPNDGDVLLARVDSVVRAHPKLRALVPDFVGSLRRSLARLDSSPALVKVEGRDVLVGGDEVRTVIAIASGEQAFVRALPLTVAQLEAGEHEPIARQVRDVLKARPMGTVMTYVMDLASGVSEERAARIRAQAPNAILRGAINFPFDHPAYRAAWDPADLGPAFRAPVVSAVPTLFMSGTLDGRTSLADAEEVRRGFRNGAHVVIDGASHNFYALTPALRDLMVRFAGGGGVRDTTLRVPVELRGPDERALVAELRRVALEQGGEAAARRLRELAAPGAPHHVSSYVVGDAIAALRREQRAAEAEALASAGVELLPGSSLLLTRLAEARAARGDRAGAADAYRRAVAADPFNRGAAVQLARLEGGAP